MFEKPRQGINEAQPLESVSLGEVHHQKQHILRDDGDEQQKRLGKQVRMDTKSPDVGM